ncbi:MAG: hypothetical protein LBI28_08820 [Treponema sp.]|jgi:hypothetical protein|nr:hypothetical protein [Treponema sp.]
MINKRFFVILVVLSILSLIFSSCEPEPKSKEGSNIQVVISLIPNNLIGQNYHLRLYENSSGNNIVAFDSGIVSGDSRIRAKINWDFIGYEYEPWETKIGLIIGTNTERFIFFINENNNISVNYSSFQ